jgi:hypothetical protein
MTPSYNSGVKMCAAASDDHLHDRRTSGGEASRAPVAPGKHGEFCAQGTGRAAPRAS